MNLHESDIFWEDEKKSVLIIVNPNSGSYDELVTHNILRTITLILDSHNSSSILQSKIGNTKRYLFDHTVIETEYAGHAKKYFSELTEKDLKNIILIIIVGGDGIIHETVNGLYQNASIYNVESDKKDLEDSYLTNSVDNVNDKKEKSDNSVFWDDTSDLSYMDLMYKKHIIPHIAICPNGSGNHLAKLVNTETKRKFIKALKNFVEGRDTIKHIVPTEIETIADLCVYKNVCPDIKILGTDRNNDPTQKSKKRPIVLSINTIIGGVPASTNNTASALAPFIPKIIAPIKYEIATIYNIFKRQYFSIQTDSGDKIDNIIGVFIQTTPSCGNNFIIDTNINGAESGVSYGYIQDMNSLMMTWELLKEKTGVKSEHFIRRYEKDKIVVLKSMTNSNQDMVTVDGQTDPIKLPAAIRKSNIMLKFLTQYN